MALPRMKQLQLLAVARSFRPAWSPTLFNGRRVGRTSAGPSSATVHDPTHLDVTFFIFAKFTWRVSVSIMGCDQISSRTSPTARPGMTLMKMRCSVLDLADHRFLLIGGNAVTRGRGDHGC